MDRGVVVTVVYEGHPDDGSEIPPIGLSNRRRATHKELSIVMRGGQPVKKIAPLE